MASSHLVVLSGAGVSAESGISTFRDSDGLWEQYRVEDVCTHEAWLRNPDLVNQFYNERRLQLPTVEPCGAHRILAELERNFDVDIITQNVDNLHERAGSTRVLHLHGELEKVTSSIHPNDPSQIRTLTPDSYIVHSDDRAADGSLLRPFIVFFGEAVPNIEPAISICQQADIFVVIGTSLNVYPAAGLLNYVPVGTPIYLIDPKPVPTPDGLNITHIQLSATPGMQQLVSLLQ